MAPITACPSCGKKNRVPTVASGTPVCGVCGASLPWIVDATASTFDGATDANVPVLVDLWAPWCGPCRMVAPVLAELASERAGRFKVVKVNVDDEPQVSARFGVQGIPTLLLFEDGDLVGRQTGALPAAALARWIDDTVRQPA
jgi:thioredoxin 2